MATSGSVGQESAVTMAACVFGGIVGVYFQIAWSLSLLMHFELAWILKFFPASVT
jgi:hypothetical protein